MSMRIQLAPLSLFVILFLGCHASTPEKVSDTLSLIARLDQQGRYDETIRVAQDWMKKHPDATSHNLALYDQIAIAYLMKASKNTEHREEWIRQAVAYYDEDLSVHQKGEIDLELYEAGRGFEMAGDLSTTDSCLYYARAVKAFEEEVSFIQGDNYTAYGRTTPLEPVRQDNEKALERVKAKFTKAGCK
jgi:hypothetical protein